MPFRLAAPDRLLRRFCRSGDPAALGELFDRTAAELLRVAVWLCGNRADAEDLLQRTFVSVIESRERYDPARRALPWLCGILGNHARKLQEQRARRLASGPAPTQERDPAAGAADAELQAAVAQLQQGLAAPYREVLDLHLAEGLNAKEIAERLGRPAGTVRTQLVRALEQLRKKLPSGFVAAVAPVLLPDAAALAGIKAAVIQVARQHIAAAAASLGGVAAWSSAGVLMSKKVMVVVPMLAVMLALAAYAGWPGSSAAAPPPGGAPAPVAAGLDPRAQAPQDPASAAASPAIDRLPVDMPSRDEVDPGFATVRIAVQWDHDGTPAQHVGVHVERVGGSRLFRRDAVTDADGAAMLRHVAPGTYYAGCSYGGFATIDVTADERREVSLQAHRKGTARGQVVDADGRAVAGARIWVSDCATWTSGFECAESDAAGRFTVPLNDDHYLGARKVGFAPSLWQMLVPREGEVLDLALTLRGPGGSVHGVVRNQQGQPVAWAKVLVGFPYAFGAMGSTFEKMLHEPMGDQLDTDRDGGFAVDGVRLGGVDVRVWAVGHSPWQQRVLVQQGTITEVEVTLTPAAVVTGTVRDTAGELVAGAHVGFGDDVKDLAVGTATSDAAGHFRLEDLPAGTVELRASKEELRTQTAIELRPGVTSTWDPVLGGGPTITGAVLDPDDQPLAGVQVGCIERYSIEPRRWCATGADGRFLLTDFGDLPVDVQLRIGDTTLQQLRAVVPGTRDLVIRLSERDLPTARLRGRVLDQFGAPVAASIRAHRGLERFGHTTTADAVTGEFALGPLPAGSYAIAVALLGRGDLPCGVVTLEPRANHDLGDVVLQAPGRLELALLDDQGRPIEQAFAVVQTLTGQSAGSARFEHGKAVVEPLQPGRRFLRVETGHGLVASAEFSLQAGETTSLTLHAQPAGRATIRFHDPDEVTDLSVRVRVLTQDGTMVTFLQTFPENETPLQLQTRLAPGSYTLECLASDGRTRTAALTIRSPDDKPELAIGLPKR